MTDPGTIGHRQRIKTRFLAGEPSALTDEALLELLLSYGLPQKDVLPLARQLLDRFGDLGGVLKADVQSICGVDGVKEHTAVLIKLVHRLSQGPNIGPPHDTVEDQSLQPWLFDLADASRPEPKAVAAVPPAAPNEAAATMPVQVIEATDHTAAERARSAGAEGLKNTRQLAQRSRTGLFGKAIFKEAVQLLPNLPETESLDEMRRFLEANLHHSGIQTRHRNAAYIARRMFAGGQADQAIRSFARRFAGQQELRDVCFYRFCRAEPLLAEVMNAVLVPAISRGMVERKVVKEYLVHRFGAAKSIRDTLWAIADVLGDSGLAQVSRTEFTFAYREPLIASVVFVIHEEFPAGMYAIEAFESHPRVQALLWNPDRLLPMLYELRNRGLIAKVSEIDSVRQFTTRWDLEGAVASLAGETGNERH